MDQGLGIEFPKIWGNLEPMRGLRLVPNIPGRNHRTVLSLIRSGHLRTGSVQPNNSRPEAATAR
jgi:hypothetical protein